MRQWYDRERGSPLGSLELEEESRPLQHHDDKPKPGQYAQTSKSTEEEEGRKEYCTHLIGDRQSWLLLVRYLEATIDCHHQGDVDDRSDE